MLRKHNLHNLYNPTNFMRILAATEMLTTGCIKTVSSIGTPDQFQSTNQLSRNNHRRKMKSGVQQQYSYSMMKQTPIVNFLGAKSLYTHSLSFHLTRVEEGTRQELWEELILYYRAGSCLHERMEMATLPSEVLSFFIFFRNFFSQAASRQP